MNPDPANIQLENVFPLRDILLVEVNRQTKEKQVGNIFLPQEHVDKMVSVVGVIKGFGPDVQQKALQRVGTPVLIKTFAGHTFKETDHIEYRLIPEEEILSVVAKPEED